MPPWYRLPIVLLYVIPVGVACVIRSVVSRNVILVLSVAGLAWHAWSDLSPTTDAERFQATHRVRAATWLRDHLSPETRVGSWNAGMIGYFSHRPIVNLDGLANDRVYFDRVIVNGELDAYLREERIEWLADQACGAMASPEGYLSRSASGDLA